MDLQQSGRRKDVLPEGATSGDIGGKLRRERLALGYSIDDMSVITGLTRQEIDDAERGIGGNPAIFMRLRAATRKF
ncbi:helix-turn-helix domain-containing protein [Neorhizobium sp. JUb45]|uniref:helix-turn-helix domain-containing protein n=1 Tax=Neorhizobium sp. JUb45 TaxID=2485113 RepID=UPI00104BF56A|nr:helix-turn-helix domain-containing protein [Neorhizobium sp. JUb45]TCQ99060.1 hypothetical protein EDF70_11047 [Neorhizobium sp. JUb45]